MSPSYKGQNCTLKGDRGHGWSCPGAKLRQD
jgi:hypothetical protein